MVRPCAWCGGSLAGKRRDAQYCSDVCRKRGHRRLSAGEPDFESELCDLVRERYGHVRSYLADLLLIVAAHVSNPNVSAASLVSLSKEMSRLMGELEPLLEAADRMPAAERAALRRARKGRPNLERAMEGL